MLTPLEECIMYVVWWAVSRTWWAMLIEDTYTISPEDKMPLSVFATIPILGDFIMLWLPMLIGEMINRNKEKR